MQAEVFERLYLRKQAAIADNILKTIDKHNFSLVSIDRQVISWAEAAELVEQSLQLLRITSQQNRIVCEQKHTELDQRKPKQFQFIPRPRRSFQEAANTVKEEREN